MQGCQSDFQFLYSDFETMNKFWVAFFWIVPLKRVRNDWHSDWFAMQLTIFKALSRQFTTGHSAGLSGLQCGCSMGVASLSLLWNCQVCVGRESVHRLFHNFHPTGLKHSRPNATYVVDVRGMNEAGLIRMNDSWGYDL